VALQQTHAATLADLSSVTAKYRDALQEISDLAAQIQEAKLATISVPPSPMTDVAIEQPPIRRRMTGTRTLELSEPQFNSAGKRLFFRQAASTESLHTR
jgi:kinesin family protein 4/21/27